MSRRFEKNPSYTLFEQHRWVDYFELICLSNLDGELDLATMQDRVELKERDGVDTGYGDSDGFADLTDFDYSTNQELFPSEKRDLRFLDYFKHFNLRAAKFEDFYPFQVENKNISLSADYNTSPLKKFYIYLLCCSSLSYFGDMQGVLTSDFEEMCNLALTNMLPGNKTHTLGKTTSGARRVYQGNVYSKLESLGNDLSAKLMVTEQDFPSTSSGDGGLDLISWYEFGDGINSIPSYAGQCKCGPEWINSRNPGDLLEAYFDLEHAPMNMFFIPFYYRKSNGEWHEKHNVKKRVVLDRLRICRLLIGELSKFESTSAYSSIEEFMREKESII